MNIFQRIKEVKLPFIAVIAALAFGGIVAPASAAAPTITVSSVNPSSTSVSISFTVAGYTNGSGCKAVVLPSTSPALTASDVVNRTQSTSAAAGDTAFEFRSLSGIASELFSQLSGLTQATSYTYYIACFEAAFASTSPLYSASFTTQSIQAPSLSAVAVSNPTSTSTVVTATPSANGACWAVVRLSLTSAPTDPDVLAVTAISATNIAFVSNRPVSASNPVSFTFSGLIASTTYKAYFVCQDPGLSASTNYNVTFTQSASSGPSYSACSPAFTITDIDIANGVTSLSPGESFSRIYNNDNSIVISTDCSAGFAANFGFRLTLDGVQIASANNGMSLVLRAAPTTYTSLANGILLGRTVNSGSVLTWNYYVGIGQQPTASDTPTISYSITLYPNGGVSAPTTAAVQRPLPQINFATSTVPGASARPTSDTRKGTLTIEGSNLSDLTAITVGGKAATFTVKDGKLEIKLPAGVTGFPELVMTNGGGSITMQNAIEIYAPKVQKLTQFVGERFTRAGVEALENAYIESKDATALEATVVVAADATEAEIAKAVKAATKAVNYIDKVGKRIVRTAVIVAKTGAAGTKPSVEMSFTK